MIEDNIDQTAESPEVIQQDETISVEQDAVAESTPEVKPESSYQELTKDLPEEFLKNFGEINSETDAKRAQDLFSNQRLANERAQELENIKKQHEQKAISDQKESLSNTDASMKQQYAQYNSNLNIMRNQELAKLKDDLVNQQITPDQYSDAVIYVNQQFDGSARVIDAEYNEKQSAWAQQRKEFLDKQNAALWAEKETVFKDKLAQDEYRAVIDLYKAEGFNKPEDTDFIVKALDTAIAVREERIARENNVKKQNEQGKSKLSSVYGIPDKKGPAGKPSLDQISKMSPQDLATWALS